MDCDKSLELLSEYHGGGLLDADVLTIRTHLELCIGCNGVFRDLESIVSAARTISEDDGIVYPDENALWLRMSIETKIIH